MSRYGLWAVLALPGAWIAGHWALASDRYGYGHAIADTGQWAAWLLMVTLAVTPVRLISKRARWTGWLLKRRRDLGVASFAYAAGHTSVYLWKKASLATVLSEAGETWLLAGWLALAFFGPLAITSNDAAMRRLKRGWKRLHRLVYPAAVLMFVHWAMSAFDPTTALWHIAVLTLLESLRVALVSHQRHAAKR